MIPFHRIRKITTKPGFFGLEKDYTLGVNPREFKIVLNNLINAAKRGEKVDVDDDCIMLYSSRGRGRFYFAFFTP